MKLLLAILLTFSMNATANPEEDLTIIRFSIELNKAEYQIDSALESKKLEGGYAGRIRYGIARDLLNSSWNAINRMVLKGVEEKNMAELVKIYRQRNRVKSKVKEFTSDFEPMEE